MWWDKSFIGLWIISLWVIVLSRVYNQKIIIILISVISSVICYSIRGFSEKKKVQPPQIPLQRFFFFHEKEFESSFQIGSANVSFAPSHFVLEFNLCKPPLCHCSYQAENTWYFYSTKTFIRILFFFQCTHKGIAQCLEHKTQQYDSKWEAPTTPFLFSKCFLTIQVFLNEIWSFIQHFLPDLHWMFNS